MSEKQFQRRTRKQNQRLVRQLSSSFIGGMVKDVEKNAIPDNAVYNMFNVVGREDGYTGRTGSKALISDPLPAFIDSSGNERKGFSITKTLNRISAVDEVNFGQLFSKEDEGRYVVTGDLKKSFYIKGVEEWSFVTTYRGVNRYRTVLVEDVSYQIENPEPGCYIRERINGSYFDGEKSRLYLCLGKSVYCGHLMEALPTYMLEEIDGNHWHKVYQSGAFGIIDAISNVTKIGDDIFIMNSGGQFRVITDNSLDKQEYFKVNAPAPSSYNMISDVYQRSQWDYRFRYIHTLTRLKGGGLNTDRKTLFIEHETCPAIIKEDAKDYSDIHSNVIPVESAILYGEPTHIRWNDHNQWLKKGLVAWDIVFSTTGYTTPTLDLRKTVLADFTAVTNMEQVLIVIQNAINMITYKMRVMITGDDTGETRFVFYSLDRDPIAWDSCPYAIEAVDDTTQIPVDEGGDMIYDPAFVDCGNPESPFMLCNPSLAPSLGVRLDNISPVDSTGEYSNIATHHTIYRSPDLSSTLSEDRSLESLRVINDPNRFVWVADIPLIRIFKGYIFEGNLYADNIKLKDYDTYSTVSSIGLGHTFDILQTHKEGGYYATDEPIATEWGDHSNLKTFAIGCEESTMFYAARLYDTDIVMTSYVFNKDDIGKNIFWEDGTVSVIRTVSEIGIAKTVDKSVKEIQGAAINPISRSFNDTTSDEILLSRMREASLRTRFFGPLPDTSLGLIIPGFIILADRGFGKLYYGETSVQFDIGYHHAGAQIDDSIEDDVTSITNSAGNIVVRTRYKTYLMYPSQVQDGGDPRFNESFFLLPTPIVVDSNKGVMYDSCVKPFDQTREIVFTSEPAIRTFGAEGYSEDLSKGTINDGVISRMSQKVFISAKEDDIIIWGTGELDAFPETN